MTAATAPDASELYALGSNPAESARLRRQSDELRPQSAELLERIGLASGQSALDLGCGPSGIIELGLSDEHELTELDDAVRAHLAGPRTLMMPHLLVVARGRKPPA